jgi:outer membrane receptor protein involved in Fe transport
MDRPARAGGFAVPSHHIQARQSAAASREGEIAMSNARFAAVVVGLAGWLLATAAAAQSGRLEGRITRPDGGPLPGVRVAVAEAQRSAFTDAAGRFGFNLAPGTYPVDLAAGGHSETVTGVAVTASAVTRLDRSLDWALSPAQSAVASVSGRTELAAEAVATIAAVPPAEIDRRAASDLPPSLFLATAGVYVAQSGAYSFALSARGFNGYLARGVAVYVDGRDVSLPFFGGQDWAAFPVPLSALAQAEVELGADAARFGANSTGGVVNLVTRRAGDRPGLLASFAAGDLATKAGDVSWGDHYGPWAAQVTGDVRQSGDDAVSRNGRAEYSTPCSAPGQTNCLPQESVALPRSDDDQNLGGSAKLDRVFADGGLLSAAGGYLRERGEVLTTDIGRIQVEDAERKWGSLSYDAEHWDLHGSYNGRAAGNEVDLATGQNLALDSRTFQGEGQTTWGFFGDRLRLMGGAWYQDEQTDSDDKSGPVEPTLLLPNNQETLLFQRVRGSSEAAFGQLEWDAAPHLQLVAGGRYDSSSLWSSQLSTRLGLGWAFAPGQTLRLRYDRGFVAPTEEDLFLQHDIAAPVNLSSLENICALQGVPCGFDLHFQPGAGPGPGVPATRVLAVGNSNLEPEHVNSFESGYSGIFGRRVFLSLDAYWTQHTDVITDLLPQLGTSLGRVNPAFGPYVPSQFLPAASQAQLLAGLQSLLGPLFPYLTTNVDGTPVLVLSSETNYGTVDAWGADLGLRVYLAAGFTAGLTYSWFNSMPRHAAPDLAYLLSANTPRNKAGVSLAYTAGSLDAALDYRWADQYLWVSGPFVGEVPSYGLVDLAAKYHLTRHLALGVDVTNLLDKQHFETFGGDLLRRQALGNLTLEW